MKRIFGSLLSAVTLFGACCFGFNAVGAEEAAKEPEAASVASNEKKDTELVFIVDKSGSMWNLTKDTIGSFNNLLDTQKNDTENGGAYVTTVMFNGKHEKIHDRKNIQEVEHITDKDYRPNGCTALLDAVGDTITELSKNEAIKDHKVVVAIITDGYENASREYNRQQVKDLIASKEKEGWKFVFCGANIDEVAEGKKIGLRKESIVGFSATGEGVRNVYDEVSQRMTEARAL